MGDKYVRWVQVEVGFPRSKLIDRARMDLGLDTDQAIGKFVRLWLAVMQTRDRGSLRDRSDAWIEEEVGWRGEPGKFAMFVRLNHIDENGVIRDWLTKYGKLDATREKTRVWKVEQRKRQLLLTAGPVDSPLDSPVDNGVDKAMDSPVDVHRDNGVSVSSSSSLSALTQEQQQPVSEKEPVRRDDPLLTVLIESGLSKWVWTEAELATLTGFLRSQRSPLSVALVVNSHLTDVHGPPSTTAAVALAMREWMANAEEKFSARYFAAFVKRAEKVLAGKPSRVQAKNEERFITSEDRAAENARREEAEVDELLRDFERTHGNEFETLKTKAEASVDRKVKGMFRVHTVRAALVKLIRAREVAT